MGITCEVVQDVFRSAERSFGVDYPILPKQLAEKTAERFRVRERAELPMKAEFAASERTLQCGDELASEDSTEHLYRKEESGTRGNPRRSIAGDPASRYDAVDVGVM
jgi:hypothetical protein